MSVYKLNQISWKEYSEIVDRSILILPTGSTEQHALHLPLGTDAMIVEQTALLLAERFNAVVAPPVNYGYKSLPASGGGPLFPGTIDLKGKTYISLIRDLLEEFIADGWKKILVLNGHFENTPFLIEAADLLLREKPPGEIKVIITDWYDHLDKNTVDHVFDEIEFPGWELEHAAIVETSVMLHFFPYLVDINKITREGLDEFPNYHIFPPSRDLIPKSGSLHTAYSSSSEKGEIIINNVLKHLVGLVQKEFCQ